MYIYFFDIDNTIADTDKFLESKLPQNYSLLNRKEQIVILEQIMTKEMYLNIPILENSATNVLETLLELGEEIYYITARESQIRTETESWLKKHKMLPKIENLIMDADEKGDIIKKILEEKHPNTKFAVLFDDSTKIHNEIALYNNIIVCLP